MIEQIADINKIINDFAWGPVMLLLLVGTGIYLTIRTGWLQVTKFKFIIKNTIGTLLKKKEKKTEKNLTPFQAVCTALAGTVGTGNIAGVTGAIFTGGPGAVFWMWFAAFFGMITKYSEIVLAVKYREEKNGVYYGGPMYYIKNGLDNKYIILAYIFAVFGGIACLGTGMMTQASEISGAMKDLFGITPLISGIIIAVVVAVVILGGVKRIGVVASYIVPFMSVFYIIAGIIIIIMRISDVPEVFSIIIREAFSLRAVEGGFMGIVIMNAMKNGISRGIFSNEAGLGTAPMAHSTTSGTEPCEQGIWGIFEVFIDTIIICTITSMAVMLSGILETEGGIAAFSSKGAAAVKAFNMILPGKTGGIIIQLSLILFAFSTILGWSYYGENCWRFISKGNEKICTLYKVIYIAVGIIGAMGNGTLVWDIADTTNGLMAIPNLIALLLLSGEVISETKKWKQKI